MAMCSNRKETEQWITKASNEQLYFRDETLCFNVTDVSEDVANTPVANRNARYILKQN